MSMYVGLTVWTLYTRNSVKDSPNYLNSVYVPQMLFIQTKGLRNTLLIFLETEDVLKKSFFGLSAYKSTDPCFTLKLIFLLKHAYIIH